MLGTDTVMIGAVGDDANGSWYLEKLAKSGVKCEKVKIVQNSTTGVAPIIRSLDFICEFNISFGSILA